MKARFGVGLCLGLLITEFSASAQLATFENISEGPLGTSFVDPLSGIAFTDGIYNFGQATFCVDYGAAPVLPPVLPGNHLTGGGYSPGGGVGLGAGFGFTFILPAPSTFVQMDALYFQQSSAGNMTITGYSSSGQLLASANVPLPGGSLGLSVIHPTLSAAMPMSRIVVATPSTFAVGFDNIGAPEPSGAALILVGTGIWILGKHKSGSLVPRAKPRRDSYGFNNPAKLAR
ncbi:MAG TPA: hypothetical protein VMB80_15360 [Candidatus Acidoferrum sp.]|nr:hypothetical protein [Candidatus Acidoferrum sp.]